jgi:hypothetical protein
VSALADGEGAVAQGQDKRGPGGDPVPALPPGAAAQGFKNATSTPTRKPFTAPRPKTPLNTHRARRAAQPKRMTLQPLSKLPGRLTTA